MERDNGLTKVLAAVSGYRLALDLGIKNQSIFNWKRVPAERVIDVERISGVSRHVIRPDIYPRERKARE